MGGKTKNECTSLPKGYLELQNANVPVELGWVNEEKLQKHTPTASMSSRVACDDEVTGVLQKLGYTKENVIKL